MKVFIEGPSFQFQVISKIGVNIYGGQRIVSLGGGGGLRRTSINYQYCGLFTSLHLALTFVNLQWSQGLLCQAKFRIKMAVFPMRRWNNGRPISSVYNWPATKILCPRYTVRRTFCSMDIKSLQYFTLRPFVHPLPRHLNVTSTLSKHICPHDSSCLCAVRLHLCWENVYRGRSVTCFRQQSKVRAHRLSMVGRGTVCPRSDGRKRPCQVCRWG